MFFTKQFALTCYKITIKHYINTSVQTRNLKYLKQNKYKLMRSEYLEY